MKIQTKIMILFSIVILVLIFAVAAFQIVEIKHKKILIEGNQKNNQQVIDQIIKFETDNLFRVAYDYSGWDDMVHFAENVDSSWAIDNMEGITKIYDISSFSVYDRNYEYIYSLIDSTDFNNEVIFEKEFVKKCFEDNSFCHFYKFSGKTLFAVYGANIVPSQDCEYRLTPSQGYIFVAKQVNDEYLEYLSSATGFTTFLKVLENENNVEQDKIINSRALTDESNKTIAYFEFVSDNLIYLERQTFINTSIIIIIVTLVSLVIFFFLLRKIITIPLNKITESLDNKDISYISKYLHKKNEFGKIAKMIDISINRKNELLIKNSQLEDQSIEIKNKNEILILHKEKGLQQAEALKKINEKIKLQKDTVEAAFQEIKSSISYAKTIQQALFTSELFIGNIFKDYFIFYKPKDIVSGDFYWIKKIFNFSIVAVADCTGHGVPGAFMSILGISLLNSIIPDKDLTKPSEILSELRSHIKKSLNHNQTKEDFYDGMDIAIFSIDFTTNELYFSGAALNIYVMRNNSLPQISNINIKKYPDAEFNLFQIEGSEMPIGVFYKETNFYTTNIVLMKNDVIYSLTDGYCDQFGGEKYEKFGSKKLRNLLFDICKSPLIIQKEMLEITFNQWIDSKSKKQVDDILVFGLKI